MPRALYMLRQWPQADWIQQWLHSDTVVIISEQALKAVISAPELLDQLPMVCNCLMSEVAQLNADEREQLPAHLLQLADPVWLELTLQCSPLISWGD